MKETRNFLNNIWVNNITNTPMVLRQKSFKINPYMKRLESMKETRNFLLNDLSAQIKHWKKQHTLQVMQKVFWYCATLGVRPIIAKYGWQTWNILGKRWKVLNNLYTWPLILHIFVYRCCALFLTPLLATLTKARFYPPKNLSVYETNIIVLWRFVSSGSSVTKKLHLMTKLYRNETQNDVPVQGFFFLEIF